MNTQVCVYIYKIHRYIHSCATHRGHTTHSCIHTGTHRGVYTRGVYYTVDIDRYTHTYTHTQFHTGNEIPDNGNPKSLDHRTI